MELNTFGGCKVNDVSIRLEHVDLLNCLNWLDIQLFQGGLQFLIIRAGALVNLLHLSSRRAFSTVQCLSAFLDLPQPMCTAQIL